MIWIHEIKDSIIAGNILFLAILYCTRDARKRTTDLYLIKGFISDIETHEGLPGALISFSGELLKADVSADLDVYYTTKNLKPGYYNLKVSYIGYKSIEVDSIKIVISESILNFQLSVESLPYQEDIIIVE